jgi:hypothetical protein
MMPALALLTTCLLLRLVVRHWLARALTATDAVCDRIDRTCATTAPAR